MFYNVFKPKDIIDNSLKLSKKTLLNENESSLNLVNIKKDEIIDTHTSAKDAAVYVIGGKIEMHFDAQKFEIKEGEMLLFKKDTHHKVLALENSEFLLIKI